MDRELLNKYNKNRISLRELKRDATNTKIKLLAICEVKDYNKQVRTKHK